MRILTNLTKYFECTNKFVDRVYLPANLEYVNKLQKHMSKSPNQDLTLQKQQVGCASASCHFISEAQWNQLHLPIILLWLSAVVVQS